MSTSKTNTSRNKNYRPLSHSEPVDLEALIQRIIKAADKKNINDRIRYKITRKIELARQHRYAKATCDETGVTILLDIPTIPGFFLSYSSPLSVLANARGIAAQPFNYLKNLDVQILAGVLITIADDYSLFRYAPSFSGAQKNAVLRSCNKLELINAIQTIEHFVNSANVTYLPQLSFLLDSTHSQNSFEQKLQQWTKLLIANICKPDTDAYDENASNSTMPRMREIISRDSKEKLAAIRQKKEATKQFKADIKMAISITKELRKHNVLSAKQKDILFQILDVTVFPTVKERVVSIIGKLELMESAEFKEDIATLAKILKRNLDSENSVNEFSLEDLDSSDSPSEATDAITASDEPLEDANNSEATFIDNETGETVKVEDDELLIEAKGQFFIVPKNEYEALSFIGKMKYRNNLLLSFQQTNSSEAGEGGEL